MRTLASVAIGALATAALAVPAGPGWVQVSRSAAGGDSAGVCGEASVTPNGRWVAFSSSGSDLVTGPASNGVNDVFVRDMKTGTTELVSRNAAGDEGNSFSQYPSVSSNGRWVLFESSASDLVDEENELKDVFVADRKTGEIARVAVGHDGSPPNDESLVYGRCLSANGRWAVFLTKATNIVEGAETFGYYQVYLRDIVAGTTRLASRDRDDPLVGASGTCVNPSISPNGRFVAFCCNSANIVPGSSNGRLHAYVIDTRTGAAARVSVGPMGALADQDSYGPAVSDNGRIVSFYSLATNLTGTADAGGYDTFLADRKTGVVRRVSESSTTDSSYDAALSANGKVVVFYGDKPDLVDGDGNGTTDVFRFDAKTGAVTRLTVDAEGVEGNGYSYASGASLSVNGKWIAVSTDADNLAGPDDDEGNQTDVLLMRLK